MVSIPQPLKSRRDAFVHSDYLFELKMDGFRSIAKIENGRCELYSRNGSKFSFFAYLAADIAVSIPVTKSAVLDGEIICLDSEGYPQFNDLLFHRGEPCFFAFDVLFLEGYDLRLNALIERKAELRRLLSSAPLTARVRYVDHVERSGSGLFELVCQRDLEGIVAKLRHGNYVTEREHSTWWKIKNRTHSQSRGRETLFERDRHAEPSPGWHSPWHVRPWRWRGYDFGLQNTGSRGLRLRKASFRGVLRLRNESLRRSCRSLRILPQGLLRLLPILPFEGVARQEAHSRMDS